MKVVTAHPEGTVLEIKVRPRAGKCRVTHRKDGTVVVEVTSAPENGQATKQALRTLARAVGLRSCDATILKGARNRKKTVLLKGLTKGACLAGLEVS
ncbi:MAG: DUF167 domain-containing protein [Deltaproteobacteria bacterium]|nr:DUF167 domain-containing protein [Deltaproteobacteria bacterium]